MTPPASSLPIPRSFGSPGGAPAAKIRGAGHGGPGDLPGLLCLPYAGGGSWVFRGWARRLCKVTRVMLVELAGRDSLLKSPPARCLQSYADALADAVLTQHHDLRLALFGHSMGALLAFELARSLRRRQAPVPRMICVSAHRAPQLPDPRPPIHALSDAKFIAELRALHGTPGEVLKHRQMMDFFMPLLRADFCCCETYRYADEPAFECPILAFGSAEDAEVEPEALAAWQVQTRGKFEMRLLAGGHFFIHEAQDALLDILERELASV